MKNFTLVFASAILAACGTEPGTFTSVKDMPTSGVTYLMAENVEIKSQRPANGRTRTVITLEYDLPCWASPVGLVDVLDNPAADFAISAGVLVKGDLMNPCMGKTRETISKALYTNAVNGQFLGVKLIDAHITLGSNPVHLAAENVSIDSQKPMASGRTSLELSYDLPCWASAVTPVPSFDVLDLQGSPGNPSAEFAIAVGVLVKGDPMHPCVGSIRKTTTRTINSNAVEGGFVGFSVITK